MMRSTMRSLMIAACLMVLAACSSDKDKDKLAELPTRPVEEVYADSLENLHAAEYKKAIDGFEQVERDYPFSVWAKRATVMAAYAHFMENEPVDTVASLEQFIKLYPDDPATPYAYYLTAVAYYDQIADVGRDQANTMKAQQALRDVVQRYPGTPYAKDARVKLDLVLDHLAGKEMTVGRYYHKQSDYLASLNRFKTVVERYDTTSHVPEALHRMVECYLALGLEDDARRTAAVLGYNYPDSRWYADSYHLLTGKGLVEEDKKESWWKSWL